MEEKIKEKKKVEAMKEVSEKSEPKEVSEKSEPKEVSEKSEPKEVSKRLKAETKDSKAPESEPKTEVKVSETDTKSKEVFAKSESKEKKREAEGVVHIYTSFNNTIVHVTDMSGQTLIKVTGGMVTKHNRLKANPTIAMFIAKRISENLKEKGVKSLYVRIRAKTGNPAPGPGAHAIVKSLSREGFRILNILDATKMARGGPKKKGGRRGRRP